MGVVRHSGILILPTIALLCDVTHGSPDDEFQELVIGVKRVETHQYAKFRQNRSVGCADIKIF